MKLGSLRYIVLALVIGVALAGPANAQHRGGGGYGGHGSSYGWHGGGGYGWHGGGYGGYWRHGWGWGWPGVYVAPPAYYYNGYAPPPYYPYPYAPPPAYYGY